AGTLDGFCRPLVDEAWFFYPYAYNFGSGTAFDDSGHGSHVAGTVAQCGGNGKYGTGVAPDASVMPVAVFNWQNGSYGASLADLYLGIGWAIDHGAKVINLSLGFSG